MSPEGKKEGQHGSSILSEQQSQLVMLNTTVASLAKSVEGLREDIKQRGKEHQETALKLSKLQADLDNALRELKGLNRIILKGNGQPSFQQRLSKLEEAEQGNDSEIEKLRSQLNARVHARELSRGQLIAGGLGIIAAIVTSLVSALAVIWKSTSP